MHQPPATILLAPDTYKGTLSAAQVRHALARGLKPLFPHANFLSAPLADGGDGFLAALADILGPHTIRTSTVTGPLGEPTRAGWILADINGTPTALIEMAQAAGLALISHIGRESALGAHTWGVGELIRHALNAGAQRIILGCGGSATTDGGSGALRALGAHVLDTTGHELPLGGGHLKQAAHLDLAGLDPRLSAMELVLAVDVLNPLHHAQGAAHMFAAQKGATDPADNALLAAGLEVWAKLVGGSWDRVPGAGAAGGTPLPFLALCPHARVMRGFDTVVEISGLDAAVAAAARPLLVVTGEGRLDAQSQLGKTPWAIASRWPGVSAVAICGQVDPAFEVEGSPFAAVAGLSDQTWDPGVGAAAEDIQEAVARLAANTLAPWAGTR